MTGLIESIFGKLGGSALSSGIKYIFRLFRPTKISRPRAPRNFFEHFGPGVSKDFVTRSIGAPHRQSQSLWLYQFADALAQFDFREDGSARSVALALTNNSPKSGFSLPTIGTPLGKLKLDAFATELEGKLSYRSSIRTWELLYTVKFPPHWASNYYTFGALSLLAPGVLLESLFDTNLADRTPRVASKGVLVNWVGISDTSEELWFEWSIALPAAL
ncbi:hypothetical protein [Lysobacter capsici]|uniref:hypothetical protein n=1 Tax=Lysobacter capsici TaxID=435897 RepID=UPI00128D2794|nr:hypothetical protein [Lysobacter capsici]